MRGQLLRRLEELKSEFAEGRKRASELEQQQVTLHQTLLRISGAIQVLEEELKVQTQGAAFNDGTSVGDTATAELSQMNGSHERVAQ